MRDEARDLRRWRRRPRRRSCRRASPGGSSAECIRTTVPRKPPSRTSRLLPRPTKSIGSPAGSVRRNAPGRRRSAGTKKRSARPPARQLTCRAIGSSRRSSPRSSELEGLGHVHVQLRRHVADRARAHGDDDVAVASATRRIAVRHVGDVLDEDRLDLAGDAHRARERAAVGGDDRRLARRIDLGEHQRVDGGEHAHEILEQVARARVAVRLEGEHQAPAGKGAARRRERRRHLGRVVAVVVDQREGAAARERDVAVALEAPADAAELRQRLDDRPSRRRRARSPRRSRRAR